MVSMWIYTVNDPDGQINILFDVLILKYNQWVINKKNMTHFNFWCPRIYLTELKWQKLSDLTPCIPWVV